MDKEENKKCLEYICYLMDIEAKLAEINEYKKYLSPDGSDYSIISDSIDSIVREANELRDRIDGEVFDFEINESVIEKDEDGGYYVWDYEHDTALCNKDGEPYHFDTIEEVREFLDTIIREEKQEQTTKGGQIVIETNN